MNYEDKYNEALKWMRSLYDGLHGATKEDAEHYFPELKESEDESIRKDIIIAVESTATRYFKKTGNMPVWYDKAIDWLEKQGKQSKQHLYDIIVVLWDLLDKIDTKSELYITDTNPDNPFRKLMHITQERHKFVKSDGYNLFIDDVKITNRKSLEKQGEHKTDFRERYNNIAKSEWFKETYEDKSVSEEDEKPTPKFKVGDWVIDKQGIVHQIENVIENMTNHTYGYDIVGGGYFNDEVEGVRLWTIDDAKDGDILANKNAIFIFKCKYRDGSPLCISYLGIIDTLESVILDFDFGIIDVHPATKEERDLLFQKIKEAGYVWDDEKKELRIIDWSKHVECDPNPPSIYEESALSEEDETSEIDGLYHAKTILEKTLGKVEGYQTDDGILEHKSAINSVTKLYEQKLVEKNKGNIGKTSSNWSEVDNVRLDEAIQMVESNGTLVRSDDAVKLVSDWLKSLKDRLQPQNNWEPSDDQLKAFEHFVRSIGEVAFISPYDSNTQLVYSLLSDLKKLKE